MNAVCSKTYPRMSVGYFVAFLFPVPGLSDAFLKDIVTNRYNFIRVEAVGATVAPPAADNPVPLALWYSASRNDHALTNNTSTYFAFDCSNYTMCEEIMQRTPPQFPNLQPPTHIRTHITYHAHTYAHRTHTHTQ